MSIFLGGTTSSNELTDYEEGTFSVSLSQGSNSNSTGHYVKIGDIVLVSGEEQCDNITSSATVQMNGLPFTALATNGYHNYLGNVRGYNWGNLRNDTRATNCCIHGSGTNVQFGTLADQGEGWEMLAYNDAGTTNNSLRWTCTYRTTT